MSEGGRWFAVSGSGGFSLMVPREVLKAAERLGWR